MSDAAASSSARRPPTPHDFSLLKGLRYEEAVEGRPPVPVASINPPKTPTSAKPSQRNLPIVDGTKESSHPPRTSPNSHPANEVKRDSGIAPSTSTATRDSYADSHYTSGGLARVPSLPTIVVHDDESPDIVERSRSPFSRKISRDRQTKVKSQSPPSTLQRIKSFKGIQTEIPTTTFEDLSSENVGFSHRGSMLFGGKKMNKMIAENTNGEAAGTSPAIPTTPTETLPQENGSPKGLVSGRRKPSVQMLQAAIQGGRVLSAEEITFSMKVRSMYDAGDENAADWVSPTGNVSSGNATPESQQRDAQTPDIGGDGLKVDKTRVQNNSGDSYTLRSPTPDLRSSSYKKDPTERAGGIEDWDEVDGQAVDRYGFINPQRVTSSGSTSSRQQVQRVATSLRLESDQPRRDRKLRRGVSNARSARSNPPKSSFEPNSTRNGPGSVHSYQSNNSSSFSSNPFRSKDRRIRDEASDMLTLPPGLADIAEQEDGGQTAKMLRRKEWAREEKWQKMARSVRERANSKGGGMKFEFDTSDPKLVNRTWKGIPDRWRATAWHSFLSASARRRGNHTSDEELAATFYRLQEMSSADDVQIDVDVPRTINMHIMFRRRYRGGQRLLFRVLHAISIHCPDTGYVQGMASLAATLLCYYDEERAFIMLVRLWQLRGLEQLFQAGFEGLLAALNEFEKDWLGGGDVAQKLEELCITSTAYGTRWYLTLFNMSIPFPAQLRVWDVFMLLGDASPSSSGQAFAGADLDVLHATSAALVDATREIILDSDFENAMKVLTSWIPVKDEDLLMRVARAEWKMRKKRAGTKA